MDSITNKSRLAEKLQKKKEHELNKEVKRNERQQKRESLVEEDIDLGRFSN